MTRGSTMDAKDKLIDALYPPPTIRREEVFLPVKRLHPDAILPRYQSAGAAGFDLHALIEGDGVTLIPPYGRVTVSTGLAFQVPDGYELQVRSRSGTGVKQGLVITHGVGTIDSDYRGEVIIALANLDNKEKPIYHGDRLAQAVLAPVVTGKLLEVEELAPSQRGSGGFGSTGHSG